MRRGLIGIGFVFIAVGLTAGALAWTFGDDWRDERDYRIVSTDGTSDGRVVVLDDDRHEREFFPLFPFLLIGGILIAIGATSSGHRRRWHREDFDGWHREAHWNWGTAGPKDTPSDPTVTKS